MNGDGVALLVVVNVGMAAADVMALLGHSHSNDGRVGDDCGCKQSKSNQNLIKIKSKLESKSEQNHIYMSKL